MAQFSIEIADEDVNRVMDAVAANYNWPENVRNPDWPAEIPNPNFDPGQPPSPDNPENIPDPNVLEIIPNPENKFVFTNRMVRKFITDHVAAHEIRLAKQAAEAATDTEVTISDPQI